MQHYTPPDDVANTVFDPTSDTFGPIMGALQSGDFRTAATLTAGLVPRSARPPQLFGTHDEEVICDVTLSTGKTLRGRFSYSDHGAPDGWASITLYDDGDDTKPERWKHVNPAHIVAIEVWQV